MLTLVTNEERQYINYIKNHIAHVQKAWDVYKNQLAKHLNINEKEMEQRIAQHDSSKWDAEEFEAYRNHFYPAENEYQDDNQFENAWKEHYELNDHHPEFWVVDNKALKMDEHAIAEMFCDWIAMSMVFGTSLVDWYNNEDINFHPDTRKKVDEIMNEYWIADVHKMIYMN